MPSVSPPSMPPYSCESHQVVKALHDLHTKLRVIHRDVKPSNILMNRASQVKMCDFGISGQLVDSLAKTVDAGCKPYMAPERINPPRDYKGYDIKSDVWSLGISMVCTQSNVLNSASFLCIICTYWDFFTRETQQYCLQKLYKDRLNYVQLLQHPFIKKHQDTDQGDVVTFVNEVLDFMEQDSAAQAAAS
ncbi:PREDICTED: dual specificity mitogen-activated protein kinase kinase 6-like [Priapulus caudatus]|uniref:mitogen-activated protein kinase kinase n=1 Tax=Priapulus caudatus TaxID=37621 RepID=A0ABM1E0B9_PRICU|nr:PREDICTED: dual specificity mitogen-activated protein kinase kinase 6-like [Priapulus caudatus]